MPSPSGKKFGRILLIGKKGSAEIEASLKDLAAFLRKRGCEVLAEGETRADLAIVIGGDGTMLNIARTFAPYDVALVGINQGRLGFLTDISVDTMLETIGTILDGDYITEGRMLLAAEIYSGEERVFDVLAFNDVVLSKGVKGSMIEFEVRIDGQFIYNQRSDGLIVASPTGSTAYALSSGGPIVHPSLDVMALVPVCPHTLSNRPIVIGGACTIEIRVLDAADPRAHFDSHSHFELKQGDRIVVRRYAHGISLLHPVGHSYYAMLREKLHWNRE